MAIALALNPSASARGQNPSLATLNPGDTIRVWAVAPRLNGVTGVLTQFRSDTLTLGNFPGHQDLRPIALIRYPALRRIDVRRGMHRSGSRIAIGVLAGGAVGFIAGAVLGPIIECGGDNCGGDLDGIVGFVVGAGLGTIVGGATGGIIGARKRPDWQSVRLTR